MPRPRSEKVSSIKARLIARIGDGLHRPGDRFMSNRAIAEHFSISYQTADRLVRELCAEGKLVRRAQSGTYLPGKRATKAGAQLVFHQRARRMGSFGARLLAELIARLDRERIAWKITWADDDRAVRVAQDHFPVIWESGASMNACVRKEQPALLLNQRPPAGLASTFLESISADDFGGGVCAAQLLLRESGQGPPQAGPDRTGESPGPSPIAARPHTRHGSAGFAILSGPADDPRSSDRVRGFLSVAAARVVPSKTWFFEEGLVVAEQVVQAGGAGVFCCNDRLAEAVLDWCSRHHAAVPPLVGFDDAPVAEQLGLTTIAIPWHEMTAAAVAVIKRRLTDTPATASRQIFAPRPVVRRLLRRG